MARTARVTIDVIARDAHVSVKTASLALNHRPGVSSETARQVLAAAERLGYNHSRASSINRPMQSIGIVVPHLGQHANNELVQRLRELSSSYQIVSTVVESGGKPDRERQLIEDFDRAGILGLVSISPRLPNQYFEHRGDSQFPTVIINRHSETDSRDSTFASISLDNLKGTRLACQYLLDTGHRSIAYLAGPPPSSSDSSRRRGYSETLVAYGLPIDERLIIEIDTPRMQPWPSFEAGQQQTLRLLDKRVTIDAIVAFNDEMAIGSIRALSDKGIRIPEDISVIGFGGIHVGQFSCPRLSSVAAQMESIAWNAIRPILCHYGLIMNTPGENIKASCWKSITLQPELLRRESCRPSPQSS